MLPTVLSKTMSSAAKTILRSSGEHKAPVNKMEFTLKHLRVGRMQMFDHLDEKNNQGAMTPLGLSLKVQLSPHSDVISLFLKMKDILSVSACLQPFLSLQLRHTATFMLANKLDLNKKDFDTRSKHLDEKVFTIFFADRTGENLTDETWMQKLLFFVVI